MEVGVSEHPAAPPRPSRKQPVGSLRSDAVDRPPEPGVERQILICRQHEREEEELTELEVTGPRLVRCVPLERWHVDEDGSRAAPLHVVRRGVFEDEAGLQGLCEEVELEEGGILKHPEAPLVRVGDEGDAVVFQGSCPGLSRSGRCVRRERHSASVHDPALLHGADEEVGSGEGFPLFQSEGAQRSTDSVRGVEDLPLAIAKRARISRSSHPRAWARARFSRRDHGGGARRA
ncbi:MAG: hypothetical protein BWY99_02810 [Synergistetes bacterium ADurb.BinA166]|nr:MAG: hypothetical protein BWY99_02810 [Synergistetes bacterium ADurb.BinA166]